MGIYDRDYYRQTVPRGGFGHFVAWSVTTWLIVINVVVFFADLISHRILWTPPEAVMVDDDSTLQSQNHVKPDPGPPLTRWGSLSIHTAIRQVQVWRFISFQFLHADIWHLLGNMIGLYFFGPIVEAHFGGRRYLAFYLLCGLAGAACFLIMAYTKVLHIRADTELIGASAGIFGLLVASAMIAPNVQVFYYFFSVTILMLAIGGMALAAYSVLANVANAGGEAAHLGGGVLGFVLMKNQHWLNPFAASMRRTARRRRRVRAFQKDWSKDFNR